MIDIIGKVFKNKKVNLKKLEDFGFQIEKGKYVYSKFLPKNKFKMSVTVTKNGEISAEIIDTDFNEPYTLYLVDNAIGSFVREIRGEYEKILEDIANKCFEEEIFKNKQTKNLIEHIRNTYGDELEYLWKKFPNNAIWRRKDTEKWYAALLTIPKSKLGVNSDEIVEILDFRVDTEELKTLVDNKKYFLGYHMNKKHWCTIILDNSVSDDEIYLMIEKSYKLAK